MSRSNMRTLIVLGIVAIILLGIVAGVMIAKQMQNNQQPPAVVLPGGAETPAAQAGTDVSGPPTVTLTGATPSVPERTLVANGSVENDTGIAILPVVSLSGSRRYVLAITSQAGSLPLNGSFSRGSIDPKISIDVVTGIKGSTPWEQEIQPPAPESRTWTLSASVSTTLGKNIQVRIWDIGPR